MWCRAHDDPSGMTTVMAYFKVVKTSTRYHPNVNIDTTQEKEEMRVSLALR
jgi:hypothetical protein